MKDKRGTHIESCQSTNCIGPCIVQLYNCIVCYLGINVGINGPRDCEYTHSGIKGPASPCNVCIG